MRKILITISEGSIARNMLYSDVLKLVSMNAQVVLLVPEDKRDFYAREFGSEVVQVIAAPRSVHSLCNRILTYLGRNGFHTDTIVTDQRTVYVKTREHISFALKYMLVQTLGRLPMFHALIRFLARFRDVDSSLMDLMRQVSPQLVFATDVQDDMDLDVLAVALRLRIRTVGMVRSWDNLTSHGLVHMVPDTLFVGNRFLKEKAVHFQRIPEARIRIVGAPQYDQFAAKEGLRPRDEFFKELGIPLSSKLVAFCGTGNYLAPHESDCATILARAIDEGRLPQDVYILYRPHPNFLSDKEEIEKLPHVYFDAGVADYTDRSQSSWEMNRDKSAHYINILAHANVVVTVASTVTLDAVIFDKPVVCVAFDGLHTEPYWLSVRRYYEVFNHYAEISKLDGFAISHSADELVRHVQGYLNDASLHAGGRARIRSEFVEPLGSASQLLARELLKELTA